MDQSTTFTKLLRVLQFRKHIKESKTFHSFIEMWNSCNILKLTSACKRINKDGCYEFVTAKSETLSKEKKSVLHSKKKRKKSSSTSSQLTVDSPDQIFEHLPSETPPTSPVNLSMIISQSYKPLHAKSTQFNKNTIAVTKGTMVNALYTISNWVFIEIVETGETGFIPIYCVRLSESSPISCESPSQNNISLLNVSIYEKPRHSCQSITNQGMPISTPPPPPGRFLSSIGPCYYNNESKISTKAQTFTREESLLSQQISNLSLHPADQDAYGTLNLTPCQNLSITIADPQPVIFRPNHRLRVIENYQRQFVGDISVLESEVVTLVNTPNPNDDWRLVKRGDGKQGYIPKHIVKLDQNFR